MWHSNTVWRTAAAGGTKRATAKHRARTTQPAATAVTTTWICALPTCLYLRFPSLPTNRFFARGRYVLDPPASGVVATCTGCDRHSNDDVGGAATTIDGDHSPGTWTSSPHSSHPTCATQAYVTIDLGAPQSLTGVTIWHYYGNSRAYCSQKLAISDSGAFAGEEVVVYDTGTCSGWCSFPIVCDGGTSGDCTPDNYGPTETADGNIFTWAPQSGQYVRHWSSRGQNAGVHFMEIDVYGC